MKNKRILAIYFPQPVSSERLPKLAETLLSVSPEVGIRPPSMLYLEISSVAHLWESEEKIVSSLLEKLKGEGVVARMAVAGSTACAGLLAMGASLPHILPPGEELIALSRFSVSALRFLANPLSPLSPEETVAVEKILSVLSLLNIQTLQEFIRIPSAAVGTRLGRFGVLLHQRACGRDPGAFTPFVPQASFQESFEFDPPVSTLEPVLFASKTLLSHLSEKLKKNLLSTLQMTLVLETEDAEETTLVVPFFRPLRSELALLAVVKEKLSQVTLSAPVLALTLELSLPVLSRGSQFHLFDRREEKGERLDELLGRLVAGLGPKFVSAAELRARHRPERAWRPAPFLSLEGAGTSPSVSGGIPGGIHRPLMLLPKPEPLEATGDPLILCSRSGRYEILRLFGPERLVGEWWDGAGHARDYFRAETKNGEHLWIFKALKNAAAPFYLHGFFD